MFVSSSRYNNDISALRDESQGLLGTLDAFKNTMAYAIYSTDGQCTFASPVLLSILDYPNSTATSFSHAAMRVEGVEPESQYKSFWQHLVNGGSFSDTVARKSALGETKWLKASYVAVNKHGVTEIHAIYHDITEHENAYFSGKAVTDALNKSMAVIEFHPDGTIITANENFTTTMKYSLADIQGKHHRMFCRDKFYQENPNFWDNLA
ncbi:MAG: PAS domain-containing protein, partial [Pseudomonadota bacterium]|nr:PAS domain-containing protein [Pseudomonadota bacterium]